MQQCEVANKHASLKKGYDFDGFPQSPIPCALATRLGVAVVHQFQRERTQRINPSFARSAPNLDSPLSLVHRFHPNPPDEDLTSPPHSVEYLGCAGSP